jgi:hypothetical protein
MAFCIFMIARNISVTTPPTIRPSPMITNGSNALSRR